MATHDYVIANGTGAAVRSDLNGALAAIVSNNSSATQPATMYAYQWWADTTTGLLKQRNAANSAWITIGTLASTNLGLLSLAGGTMTGVLAVTAGTAALPGIVVSGDTNTGIYSPGADQLAISTGGTFSVAVDGSGRLLVGTSTARGLFFTGATSALSQIEGNSTATASLSITRNDATSDANALILAKARSTSYAILQYVDGTTSDDRIGRISFQGADGTSMVPAASIEAFVDGTPGANDMPGRLVFSTTADGAASPTERMRIQADGKLLLGTTTVGFGSQNGFTFEPASASYQTISHPNGAASGSDYVVFGYNGSKIGSITQSGTTATLYNVTSDQRLKENIVDAPEFGNVIDSIQVRSFDWITDQTHQRAGFIAQELVTVAPEAVHQPLNPDEMMAVDYSKLVPMLVKEIQSLRTRLAAAGIA